MIKAKLIGGSIGEIIEIEKKDNIIELPISHLESTTLEQPIPKRAEVYIEKYKHKESMVDPVTGNSVEVYEFISREKVL